MDEPLAACSVELATGAGSMRRYDNASGMTETEAPLSTKKEILLVLSVTNNNLFVDETPAQTRAFTALDERFPHARSYILLDTCAHAHRKLNGTNIEH